MRVFLFCQNVRLSCYVTIPQFCHNAWWCWYNTPDLMRYVRALCWCSFAVYECVGREIEVQGIVNEDFNFCKATFAPPSKWRPWHAPCLAYPIYATGSNYISDLAWSRLGVETVELSEIAVDHEVFRVLLGLLPPRLSPKEKLAWKWVNEWVVAPTYLNLAIYEMVFGLFAKSERRIQIIKYIWTKTCVFVKMR